MNVCVAWIYVFKVEVSPTDGMCKYIIYPFTYVFKVRFNIIPLSSKKLNFINDYWLYLITVCLLYSEFYTRNRKQEMLIRGNGNQTKQIPLIFVDVKRMKRCHVSFILPFTVNQNGVVPNVHNFGGFQICFSIDKMVPILQLEDILI